MMLWYFFTSCIIIATYDPQENSPLPNNAGFINPDIILQWTNKENDANDDNRKNLE